MVTLLYRTLQSTLGYDTVIRCTWVMAASRNCAFKIAAKSLQIKTRVLLTVCRKLGTRHRPIHWYLCRFPIYDELFSHNTYITDRQQTDRHNLAAKGTTVSRPTVGDE